MCGILGIVRARQQRRAQLEHAASLLAHRGPDGVQIEQDDEVAFAHSLLSIIGSTEIVQPIRSSDGVGLLTFNGEIYNYLELLDQDPELAERCAGRPRSDTITLVEGLRLRGLDFLHELNGMFAFAYYDRRRRETWIVRDRVGIKPLFYATEADTVIFGSEARAVRTLANHGHDPSPVGYYAYTRFRYPILGRSFDRGLRQLPPGHLLRIPTRGGLELRRWWHPRVNDVFEGDYEQARERVEQLLFESVRLRMRSDRDFCTYLSGGLDSSLLTALAVRARPQVDSYSIGIDGHPASDESRWSARVAQALGTRHHSYALDSHEYREQHRQLVRHLQEPVGVPNQVALKVLSRELSRDHRVVLSGEGADEVFGGYGRIFLLPHDWELLNRSEGDTQVFERLQQRYGDRRPQSFIELFLRRYGYTTHAHAKELLEPLFPGEDFDRIEATLQAELLQLWNRLEAACAFNRMLLLFQHVHLPGLLYRADTASMAHSVEARVPFLDHRLLEFVNRLPFSFKIRRLLAENESRFMTGDEISERHDIPKVLLKQIAEPLLPSEIVYRRKVGFPIPDTFYSPPEAAELSGYRAWTTSNLMLMEEVD